MTHPPNVQLHTCTCEEFVGPAGAHPAERCPRALLARVWLGSKAFPSTRLAGRRRGQAGTSDRAQIGSSSLAFDGSKPCS